jgi:hypothetical protein
MNSKEAQIRSSGRATMTGRGSVIGTTTTNTRSWTPSP